MSRLPKPAVKRTLGICGKHIAPGYGLVDALDRGGENATEENGRRRYHAETIARAGSGSQFVTAARYRALLGETMFSNAPTPPFSGAR